MLDNFEIFEEGRSEAYAYLRESDDLYDVLQWYLFEYGNESSIWDSSGFHGFMTALQCGPKPISPSIWLPQIWGDSDPQWESKDDFAAFFDLVMRVNNNIAEDLGTRHFELLFLADDQYVNPTYWCLGFARGKKLWKIKKEDAEFIDEHTRTIHMFTFENGRMGFVQDVKDIFVSYGVDENQILTDENFQKNYAKIIDRIVKEAQALFDRFRLAHLDAPYFDIEHAIVHRSPRVGRNEKCPCGSGKKFKKCCLKK